MGRKVYTVDRIRAIQSGHTISRNNEWLADMEAEEEMQEFVGEWKTAWQREREMQSVREREAERERGIKRDREGVTERERERKSGKWKS